MHCRRQFDTTTILVYAYVKSQNIYTPLVPLVHWDAKPVFNIKLNWISAGCVGVVMIVVGVAITEPQKLSEKMT